MPRNPSPPRSRSPSFSDSSAEGGKSPPSEQSEGLGPSISRPASSTGQRPPDIINIDAEEPYDTATCLWDGCGRVFTELHILIRHIHDDHIGVHKSNYSCEWSTCQRRGLAQTSRFALISHIRSHTGEKPFTCTLPECDKSFTRSDALAKHLRLQHNISPPAPGRGGNRKRKRVADDQASASNATPSQAQAAANNGNNNGTSSGNTGAFNTFKVEPSSYPESLSDSRFGRPQNQNTNGRHRSLSPPDPPFQLHAGSPDPNRPEGDEENDLSASDMLPAHLLTHYVPETNMVLGRSVPMALYLTMKAKHRFAMKQHESLLEELRMIRAELKKEKDDKEAALDQLLGHMFGPQADYLMSRPPSPTEVTMAPPHPSATLPPLPPATHMANGSAR